ncbi:polysaccharide deacetylase family protein [Planotetraspora kaengkrachanensis]|uniref:NodB homology domain-containing protein n=1 Tax=Planotetraspora kaengkrachanensis TaxID=575193 RepID=A0A8J3VA48_9ACTN|nr:polysaccharide deacetylase family protein [Planotetraspora kaengkrachanensis]GIG83127.1 hypothetical protein Pka01_62540 [Planotetraspora kaengkrachanensis]
MSKIRSRWILALSAVVVLLVTAGAGWTARAVTSDDSSAVALPPAPENSVTIVTIGFDDGTADQMQTLPLLRAQGFPATYYINSGKVGQKDFMTWGQVAELAAAGHEVGGHTLSHAKLAGLSRTKLRQEICDDRVALFEKGYAPVSFAYPYGSYDDDAAATAAACGYNSARRTGGVDDKRTFAETVPPTAPFVVRAHSTNYPPKEVLAQIKAGITAAQSHGGGWYNIYLHHICETCPTYSMPPSDFADLLTWLRERVDDGSIIIRTAGQVIGGPVHPPISAAELETAGPR